MAYKNIKIGHVNIRSLYPSIVDVEMILMNRGLDVLGITETWLTENISDEAVKIDNYNFIRLDRGNNRRGGGTGVYIRSTLKTSLVAEFSQSEFIRNGKRNSQEGASLAPSSNSSCLEARNVSGSDCRDNENISSQSELIINEGILNNDEDEHEPHFLFDDHDDSVDEFKVEYLSNTSAHTIQIGPILDQTLPENDLKVLLANSALSDLLVILEPTHRLSNLIENPQGE
ncbi:hypothetical protein JTB14_037466 [Gonioctena quinquepunctata]|nr:hypothetical protein JTB14_037466 [Gonioctena quinquepunctata]